MRFRAILAISGIFLSMNTAAWAARADCVTCDVPPARLGESRYPKLNADGTKVVFQSTAKLIPEDKDKNSDVYVWEKAGRKLQRLRGKGSVRRNGGPSISGDGKTVVFHSYPPKPRDPNQPTPSDVVMWDLEKGSFTIINRPASGAAHDGEAVFPLINKNGQWILFSSNDSNLLPGKPQAVRTLYLYDRRTSGLINLSLTDQGQWANRSSGDPRMSDDSRQILFRSAATNLCGDLPIDSLANHLYLLDRFSGDIYRIDEKERGLDPAIWGVGAADMDAQGGIIVLEAHDRRAKDPFAYLKSTDLFVYTAADGKVRPLPGESFKSRAKNPAISANGRYVVYISHAKENEEGSVVIYDLRTNKWKRGGGATCLHPDISDDGTTVAYECEQRGGRRKVRHIYLLRNPLYAGD